MKIKARTQIPSLAIFIYQTQEALDGSMIICVFVPYRKGNNFL